MNRSFAVTTWIEVCRSFDFTNSLPYEKLIEEFARRIETHEREACAAACDAERVSADETGTESDFAYNQALTDAVAAIRAR